MANLLLLVGGPALKFEVRLSSGQVEVLATILILLFELLKQPL